ncbi:site-specific integrase [Desulfosarcina sp.]|nr:site-specific integrase [Desulfosarcina sp.]
MAREKLTAGRIRNFECPAGTDQAFLWDTEVPFLAVRATSKGSKSFVFQSRFYGKSVRITIGSVKAWSIDSADPEQPGARQRARQLQTQIDQGIDPREQKKERKAAQVEKKKESIRKEATVKEAWDHYLEDRKDRWSTRHYADHVVIAQPGGKKVKRGKGKLKAGPLAKLMKLKLADLDQRKVKAWLKAEADKRPARARLAFSLLKAFINWCGDRPEYKGLCSPDVCSSRIKKDYLPKQQPKTDCLQKEQLPVWFKAVRGYHNPVISAYLQALLLVGARREELAGLQWDDVDFEWQSITIHDKVDGQRTIPLSPYVASILESLPRRNTWVFSSVTAATGRIREPAHAHKKCLVQAGIEGLTIHGLRRSFGTLSEWVEVPAGVVAQLMGHKPSAIAEKHYRQRPLDLLRLWHVKIEKWILDQAQIKQPEPGTGGLKIVQTA